MSPETRPTGKHRLNRIRIKIERAKKNLTEMNVEMASFGGHEQEVILVELDSATGYRSEQPCDLPRFPSNVVAAAGDVVHNLRSALDHLAYQLVLAAGGEPSSHTAFPISKDAAAYERDKTTKVKGMSSEAIKAIDSLKPYHGGNEPLWRLHQLNNIDKHRMIFAIGRNALIYAPWVEDVYGVQQFLVKSSDPHFSGVSDREVEKDMYSTITKTVNKPKIPRGDPMLPTLHQLSEFVERLIFGFETLLD